MEKKEEILQGFSISAFLNDEKNSGWNPDTKRGYRSCLYNLWEFSTRNGPPDREKLERWRQELQTNYSWRSVNRYLAAANNYFRWCGRLDLVQEHCRPQAVETPAEPLTRAEYLKLLRTARVQEQQRTYLLVKLFVTTGVPLQCLDQVTAELIRQGSGTISHHGNEEPFHCPEVLQKELLDYMALNGIYRGPVFITRSGHPLDRSNLCRSLQELCRQAGVPESKGNPRSLRGLYKVTQAEIHETVERLQRKIYDQLLETEQMSIGWQSNEANRPA
ncbi:MAG: tyrosine-type recombinase/integrase [Gemmiger sp.]